MASQGVKGAGDIRMTVLAYAGIAFYKNKRSMLETLKLTSLLNTEFCVKSMMYLLALVFVSARYVSTKT